MKRQILPLPFVTILIFSQVANAAIYECTYKTKRGFKVIASFNPILVNKPNYKELKTAYAKGNCRELIVKKYFINGVSCNIQFYKRNMKIGNLVCKDNNETALKELKKIARKEFNYRGD